MNFKIILLAAGEGSRMRPFSTPENPKILLPFLGKPLLAWQLESFISKGHTDFILVCNSRNKERIEKYFTDYKPQKVKINYALQEEQLGPSHAIWCARKFFQKEDYLLFKYADSVTDSDQIDSLTSTWKKYPTQAVLTLKQVEHPEEYGIVKFENQGRRAFSKLSSMKNLGYVTQIIEKPSAKEAPSNFAVVGIGIIQAKLFLKGIEQDQLFKGKKEVVPQEYILRQGKKSSWWIYQGKSIDLGRPWNVLEVNKLFIDLYLDKKVAAQFKNSKISTKAYIHPSAVIDPNCIIEDYTSIDANAHIYSQTQIKNSYLMPGVEIGENSKIDSSVIGRNTKIGKNFKTETKAEKQIKVWVKDKLHETTYKNLGCFIGNGVEIEDNVIAKPGKVVYDHKKINDNINQDYL